MIQPSQDWPSYFRRRKNWKKRQLEPFAQDAARILEQGRVVEGDGELQARGSAYGFPVRIRLEYSSNEWLCTEVEARFASKHFRDFLVLFSSSYVPQEADDDPWSDDDTVRLFLAKHTAIEGDRDAVAQQHDTLMQLPSDLRSYIVQYAHGCRASVCCHCEGGNVGVRDLGEAPDPFLALQQAVWILGSLGREFPALAPQEHGNGAIILGEVVCAYCGARYPQHNPTCTYCGAPRRE